MIVLPTSPVEMMAVKCPDYRTKNKNRHMNGNRKNGWKKRKKEIWNSDLKIIDRAGSINNETRQLLTSLP